MMQEHVGGARGVGACIGSDNAIEAEDRLDRIALEPLVENIARRAGEAFAKLGGVSSAIARSTSTIRSSRAS
jgi:hypothetical protein